MFNTHNDLSVSNAQEIAFRRGLDVAPVSVGKQRPRAHMLKVQNVVDTRFSVSSALGINVSGFKKILYCFTEVKMQLNGEDIYINKRSAATRLGLSISKVKEIASTNNIERFQHYAKLRARIIEVHIAFCDSLPPTSNIGPISPCAGWL